MNNNNVKTVSVDLGGRILSIETGKIAKQAGGAVVVRCGDTVVFVSACAQKEAREGIDFFPLTVDYREKYYAAGKFPGGFFKREGRPTEHEILTMRLIDRPIRPLFPEGYHNEVQVMASVLSSDDGENLPDILAMIGASAALAISDIPFAEPLASVRIGLVDDNFIINPSLSQLEESKLDVIMAGTEDAVMMVEGGAKLVSEDKLLEALEFGHESIKPIIAIINDLVKQCGKEKILPEEKTVNTELVSKVTALFEPKVTESFKIYDKQENEKLLDTAKEEILAEFKNEEDPNNEALLKEVKEICYNVKKDTVRKLILETNARSDGRSYTDIREITCEVGLLPRVHGSALFTRGQTQALVAITLGTGDDAQREDGLLGESSKDFMLHYNFPPFSVGECRPVRGVGRREIGHGHLAERSLRVVRPDADKFPYTIRVVSEIMESNGSSSMASVCGGSLALMDAGAPIKGIVSGIAMGLIKDGDKFAVLSDILGSEDHLGDMDFKVTGTDEGITALQMDIKIKGISFDIMKQALAQAKEGRCFILNKMKEALSEARPDMSIHAPRIEKVTVPKEKIGDIIGPGGKTIKAIVEETEAKIDIDDQTGPVTGTVSICSKNADSLARAKEIIIGLISDPEVGKIYDAKIVKIMDFGAFAEFMPKKEGLIHISQLDTARVDKVEDVVSEGDMVKVKLLEIDKMRRFNLSIKAAKEAS